MIIKNNAEFGVELALAVPYAYWLHKNNQLEYVVTSKGMKPFYYFSDDVREEFKHRTIDNAEAGLNELPNNWIHGINPLEEPGVLDYSQWTPPPYKEHYKNDEIDLGRPIVFVSNKFNLEHGEEPYGYFDVECLFHIFQKLTDKGYAVVYKRVDNRDPRFTIDQNEATSVLQGYGYILAKVPESDDFISDWDLARNFENVYLFQDIVDEHSKYSFNEVQLKVMANSKGFITVCGGNSILSSYFGGTVLSYVHKGAELRPNYFGKNSYFRKLSEANVIPIYDVIANCNNVEYAEKNGYKVNHTGTNDYSDLHKNIEERF